MQAIRQASRTWRPATRTTTGWSSACAKTSYSLRPFSSTSPSSSSTAGTSEGNHLLKKISQNLRQKPSSSDATDSSSSEVLPAAGAIPGSEVVSKPGSLSHRRYLPNVRDYRLYAQCTNNNVILTLAVVHDQERIGPQKCKTIAWVSGGTCKFKNAQRASYEAGYRASVAMFERIEREVENKDLDMRLEILFSGRGMGREALQKALLTAEGNAVRDLVWKVTDRTPIKIGGTRAKKARRL